MQTYEAENWLGKMADLLPNGAPRMPDWSFSTTPGRWHTYEWLVIVGAIVAFAMAWAIGANDVANAFGTSVGAKTIKLWQACLIASIFEFGGSIALGSQVTATVAGSITSASYFKSVPEVFAFGMLCALIAAWLWVTTATYLEMAVSTTHSIIGAIMGFGLVYGGSQAIVWNETTASFPYRKGLTPIVIAWFSSPILSGAVAAFLLTLNRVFILRRANSTLLALIFLPPLVTLTIFINVFFVLYKGARATLAWSDDKAAWVAICVAGGCGLLTIPLVLLLRRRFAIHVNKHGSMHPAQQPEPELARDSRDWQVQDEAGAGWAARLYRCLVHSLTVDVHEDLHKDEAVAAMHSAAEVFDPRTEEVYKYLQVFSACCVSFAHGANDVANAVGPFSAIWAVYNTRHIGSTADTPVWVLALGGAGLVTGLATYGYNIIKVLGVKMAKMTPSRGYCAELATSFTVAMASVYGLPVSTTHCIVGGEVGVGMVEGLREGANWKLLLKTICAWGFTLVAAGGVSAALFSFGSFSPSFVNQQTVNQYQDLVMGLLDKHSELLNASNHVHGSVLGGLDRGLDAMLRSMRGNLSLMQEHKAGPMDLHYVRQLFTHSNALLFSQLTPSVGFNKSAALFNRQAIWVPPLAV